MAKETSVGITFKQFLNEAVVDVPIVVKAKKQLKLIKRSGLKDMRNDVKSYVDSPNSCEGQGR